MNHALIKIDVDGNGVRDHETTIAVSGDRNKLVDFCVEHFGEKPVIENSSFRWHYYTIKDLDVEII